MKTKLFNFLLILTSLIGYLEWSGDSHMFLFQVEAEIISKLFTDPASIVHPFTILPMLGQILLIITLFQNPPNKLLTFISIGGLGILFAFMFVIGLMAFNIKILSSTIPFIVIAILAIKENRKNTKHT